MKTKLQTAIEALEEIKDLGYEIVELEKEATYRYFCAAKADIALNVIKHAPETLTVDQQVEDIQHFNANKDLKELATDYIRILKKDITNSDKMMSAIQEILIKEGYIK